MRRNLVNWSAVICSVLRVINDPLSRESTDISEGQRSEIEAEYEKLTKDDPPIIEGFDFEAFSARQKRYLEAKDFAENPGMGNLCQLLTSEISELYEAYRKMCLNKESDHADEMRATGCEVLTCAEEEIADIFIRTIQLARICKVDIVRAVLAKMAFNEKRPLRHGGKVV